MIWSYGLMTVSSRRRDLLPRTLASLRAGGFEQPRLFLDGGTHEEAASYEREFSLPVSARNPALQIAPNWTLTLLELYLRNPHADRYMIAQDDLICVRNLRQYLEACAYPLSGYLNLYLYAHNEQHCPTPGWHQSNQKGLGALMLVFSNEAAITLLSSQEFLRRPKDLAGWRCVDGGIVHCLRRAGWREYVHRPGLVQHTGIVSTNSKEKGITPLEDVKFPRSHWHPSTLAHTFPGEQFDALSLLSSLPATAKASPMSERLQAVLSFFRPLPEAKVWSNDTDEVYVEWDGADGHCRYHDTPDGVKMEFVAQVANIAG